MPVDPRDFRFHRAVVYDQVQKGAVTEAERYVDAVEARCLRDVDSDPSATSELADLRGFLVAVKAAASLADGLDQDLDDLLKSLSTD